ncbi:hypothetical protein AGMMS49545_17970 [Betaproteobacteria bacterium]|nr:hypothetical protein AGMMS49545_17970 [Betaproteobacteria bacterium]GHU44683.1 hypothetical protein AGMMS50289_13570 [Betaproteobacteria bacterium]
MASGLGGLGSILNTANNIRSAYDLGRSDMVVADICKLIAQVSASAAAQSFFRTYSALDGLGAKFGLWKLGQAINGKGIENEKAFAGFIAAEVVGQLIDQMREVPIGHGFTTNCIPMKWHPMKWHPTPTISTSTPVPGSFPATHWRLTLTVTA